MAGVRRLSRDRIVDEALAMARDEGVAAVTLRPLAARLGVGASALYRHVASRDELLALMHARVTDSPSAVPDEPWEPALRRVAVTTWDIYEPYPGLAAEAVAGRAVTDGSIADAARLVDMLVRGGFPPEEAPLRLLTFVQWILRFIATTERHPPPGTPAQTPAVQLPDPRSLYDHGVDLLIEGLRARLPG